MKSLRPTAAFVCLLASSSLTGCYTQLYTRGYTERAVEPYAYGQDAVNDSAGGDSLASRSPDTLYRPASVVVNNYYRESPYYRGYRIDEWDCPAVTLGFYSSRYRDYYGAYWWNDPYYRGGYHRGYDGVDRRGNGYRGGAVVVGGNAGPYHSDKRIFAPAAEQPVLRKGRRSAPAAAQPASEPAPAQAPAPKYDSGPTPAPAPADEPSRSERSDAKSESSSSSSSSDDHPKLQKGRRR